MPILMTVTRLSTQEEEADTWFISSLDLPVTNSSRELLQSFPKRIRKNNIRKVKTFHDRGIFAETIHCDHLSLYRDIPVLIDHERRAVLGTSKSFIAEFIKRFLVVFMVTDGYIDRYFAPGDGKNPVALNLLVKCDNVLLAFMYFCKDSEKKSGIWHYSLLRMMMRASSHTAGVNHMPFPSNRIEYVNFMHHLNYTKKWAGAKRASYEDEDLLRRLYPFQFFSRPPLNTIETTLDSNEILEYSNKHQH